MNRLLLLILATLTASCGGSGANHPKLTGFDAQAIAGTYQADCTSANGVYSAIYFTPTDYGFEIDSRGLVTGFDDQGNTATWQLHQTASNDYQGDRDFVRYSVVYHERLILNLGSLATWKASLNSGDSWTRFEVVKIQSNN